MITDTQFAAWLADSTALRVTLFEVGAISGGVEVTRYLSNRAYTGSAAAPYQAIVAGGLTVTESISPTADASLAAGDIEIYNVAGERDAWLDDVWKNCPVVAFVGDVRWPRADFRMVFSGTIIDIGCKSRDRLNLRLTNKMERLNTPVTDVKIGGNATNPDALVPVVLGEASNISPPLTNPNTLEYAFGWPGSEGILGLTTPEMRTDGKPRTAITVTKSTGRVTFNEAVGPGQVTCSVQGVKYQGEYVYTISKLVQCLVTTFGNAANRFIGPSVLLAAGNYSYGATDLFGFARATTATYTGADGSIQAAAANVPRIDYSTGAGQLLVEGAATNLLRFSEQADNTLFTKGMLTVVANAALAPDGTMTADKLVENTALGQHSLLQAVPSASLAPSTWYAWSRFYKAAGRNFVFASVGTFASQAATTSIYLNLITGQVTGTGAARATVQQYPDGWWRLTVTCQTNAAPGNVSPGSYIAESQTSNNYQGDGTSGVYVWGGQFEALPTSGPASSYIPTTTAVATRAADVAYYSNDLDSASLAAFDAANPQPVGLALTERTNVLVAIQQLASSVGAQPVMSMTGRLRLVQFDIPTSAAIEILRSHQLDKSIAVVNRTEVAASVKVGYCRNWTVQPKLETLLPAAHKNLYSQQWLSTTATDTAVQAIYRLDAEPVQIDTCLLRVADAQVEAARRLAIAKVPRTTYRFEASPAQMLTQLGAAVKLYSNRFGLSTGRVGLVTSRTLDWNNFHVTLEVTV